MSYDMEMEEYHEERLHRENELLYNVASSDGNIAWNFSENELLYKKNKPKHKHNIILEFIKATSLILILILQIMLFFKLN